MTMKIEILSTSIQALDQCEMMLSKLGIIRITTKDTASAAQVIEENLYCRSINCIQPLTLLQTVASDGMRDIGAVASPRAAQIYGLDILAERIQVIILSILVVSMRPQFLHL